MESYNDYIEDDNYYGDYYKNNNKGDLGATRFKRIPIHKITKDSVIPDEPQEKHDKPNDSAFEKELKAISEKIEQHQKNKEELYEKIKSEKVGKSPEVHNYITEIKSIKEQLTPIEAQISDLSAQLTVPLAEQKRLKGLRLSIEKETDIKDYDRLMGEIEIIQEKLGFGTMSAKEESNLVIRKNKLEAQAPRVKQLRDIKVKLTKLIGDNKEPFEKLKALRKTKDSLYDRKKVLHGKIDAIKTTVKENEPAIEQLKLQIEDVKKSIKNLNEEYYNKEQEWNKKWKDFEEYMVIVEHIRECKKKQQEIIKYEEKMKKRADKEADKEKKQNKVSSTVEIVLQKSDDTEETLVLKNLITYFRSLLPKNENVVQTTKTTTSVSDKINEDLKKGLVSVFDRDAINNEQVLGIASNKVAKKEKGPKVSKREQKSLQSDLLLLGVDVSSQIKELNLTAPNKKSQVEVFVQTLEKRLETIKSSAGLVVSNDN